MAFKIALAEAAFRDIDEATAFIAHDSPDQARAWLAGIFPIIDSLQSLPKRYAVIPEAAALARELRSVHYHSHRIVYEVDESAQTVYIVRVYHGARRPLSSGDLG